MFVKWRSGPFPARTPCARMLHGAAGAQLEERPVVIPGRCRDVTNHEARPALHDTARRIRARRAHPWGAPFANQKPRSEPNVILNAQPASGSKRRVHQK